jgi:hypothetical protein
LDDSEFISANSSCRENPFHDFRKLFRVILLARWVAQRQLNCRSRLSAYLAQEHAVPDDAVTVAEAGESNDGSDNALPGLLVLPRI